MAVRALADALCANRFLKHLGLGHCGIGDLGATLLFRDGVTHNTTLQSVDLENNGISDSGAEAIGAALMYNCSLLTILLDRNKIKTQGALSIANGLLESRRVKTVSLGWNRLRETGINHLLQAVATVRSVTALSLCNTEMGPGSANVLKETLRPSASPIKILNLAGNRISDGLIELTTGLVDNQHLKELNLASNHIDPAAATHFGMALSASAVRMSSLVSLSLANNQFMGHGGLRPILRGLRSHRTLRYLDITNTGCPADAGFDIADLLSTCDNLASLLMGDNSTVGPDGLTPIITALGTGACPKLAYLSFENCGFDLDATRALAREIRNRYDHQLGIPALNFRENRVGDLGVQALLEALSERAVADYNHLVFLDLSYNNLSSASAETLCSTLVAHEASLPHIALRGNVVTFDTDTSDFHFARAVTHGIAPTTAPLGGQLDRTLDDRYISGEGMITILTQETAFRHLGKDPPLDPPPPVIDPSRFHELATSFGSVLEKVPPHHKGMLGTDPTAAGLADPPGTAPVNRTAVLPPPKSDRDVENAGMQNNDAVFGRVSHAANVTAAHLSSAISPNQVTTALRNAPDPSGRPSPIFLPALGPYKHPPFKQEAAGHVPPPSSVTSPVPPRKSDGTSGVLIDPSCGTIVAPGSRMINGRPASATLSRTIVHTPAAQRDPVATSPQSGRPLRGSQSASDRLQESRVIHNIGNLMIGEDQLRYRFNTMDADGNGWITRADFLEMFKRIENYGLEYTEADFDRIMNKYQPLNRDRVTFDEFCAVMLAVVQR
eukprot:NODE_179_length_2552_cov_13.896524_g136_i0.p1 GENE.NODE_179_length_2552_cov_13.896524_g136_i0~~NODE_179_length_2552_cov_13.896524_g136_i0.p1  ORF type:complete len:810 (-),score=192.96 NODE_179_length_2552_cov_13.896524_g136_i0:121-2469(-)